MDKIAAKRTELKSVFESDKTASTPLNKKRKLSQEMTNLLN